MKKQQKQDLANYKAGDPIPKSFENVFLEDCFKHLSESEEVTETFNSVCYGEMFTRLADMHWFIGCDPEEDNLSMKQFSIIDQKVEGSFHNLYPERKLHIVLALLSRTPDGEAVMSFLDVETRYREIERYSNNHPWSDYDEARKDCLEAGFKEPPKTLDHLLFSQFTEALRFGKPFEEALKIINKTYFINVYA